MRATNEELQSANEELHSTLEELETSKEELQSMNEELVTLNQENRHKVEELAQVTSDLQNLLASMEIATVFLDRELRIMRFTPRLGELFNVWHGDRGRPLSDLTHRLGYQELLSDATQVLERLIPVEREVQSEQGQWYLCRVLPYRADDRIDGVVITFVDITRRKEAEDALRESQELLAQELAVTRLLHEMTMRVVTASELKEWVMCSS
jgi:two-component system CheB/CheR fusion protein